jgi:hypothetical protein
MKIELAAGALIVLSACGTFVAPQGFATYDDWLEPYRAVSPEGVVFSQRTEEQKPQADLPFWKEALKNRMTQAGYVFQRDGDISAHGTAGYVIELAAPFGPEDYGYIVAIFPEGDDLVLFEAAGEVKKLEARRAAILAAIEASPL